MIAGFLNHQSEIQNKWSAVGNLCPCFFRGLWMINLKWEKMLSHYVREQDTTSDQVFDTTSRQLGFIRHQLLTVAGSRVFTIHILPVHSWYHSSALAPVLQNTRGASRPMVTMSKVKRPQTYGRHPPASCNQWRNTGVTLARVSVLIVAFLN